MMRGIRRLVAYAAVSGLLAAGAVGVSMEVAHATFLLPCHGNSGDSYRCSLTNTYASVATLSVIVTDDNNTASAPASEDVTVSWTATGLTCTDSSLGAESAAAGGVTGLTTLHVPLPLPVTEDGTCNVTVTISGPSSSPAPFTAQLSYSPNTSPSPTPTSTSSAAAVHPIKGFDGKCVDDKGNSSANGAAIVIWSCSGTDQAEGWTFNYGNGEFSHNGKCMNDQGNGGIRSHVILYTCNGGSNEKWSVLANGELKLKSHGGTLCADDPRSSTTNGTQLIVYTCTDSANQRWTLP